MGAGLGKLASHLLQPTRNAATRAPDAALAAAYAARTLQSQERMEAADAAVFGTRVAEAQKLARAAEYVQF